MGAAAARQERPEPGACEPRISVVIPALDERDALPRALECTQGPGVERIVVDGGSGDGTPEVARASGGEKVIRAAPGRARQLSAAI